MSQTKKTFDQGNQSSTLTLVCRPQYIRSNDAVNNGPWMSPARNRILPTCGANVHSINRNVAGFAIRINRIEIRPPTWVYTRAVG